ncbi:MAG: efflux transporter periplasmic adaptor subunit, partial [Acidobacteriota bacterium]
QLLEQGWPVDLTPGDDATPSWQGRVSRVEQHVVSASRQRSLVVTVPNPLDLEPPLFPGTFVRASLAGRELNGVLDLPVSAITEQQEIWFVDDQGRLARMPVEALMASDGRALVRPPAALDWANGLDVLVHPMASYLPGIAVDRQRIEDADR